MEFDTIYGIDFSGSSTAGKKIWVTEANRDGEKFRVESVQRIDDHLSLPSRIRETVLQELQREIRTSDEKTIFGLDFPFSLPEKILIQDDWIDFVSSFPDEFLSPENLQRVCSDRAQLVGGTDDVQLNRETETESGGLCPYNAQIRLQTYYGIRELLRPLALMRTARIPPMLTSPEDVATVVEVYPSATIQEKTGLKSTGYKSNSDAAKELRRKLLDEFLPTNSDIDEEQLVSDQEADGIDSLIAANAVNRYCEEVSDTQTEEGTPVEGRIYV